MTARRLLAALWLCAAVLAGGEEPARAHVAVLGFRNLKQEAASDWIGQTAASNLTTKLAGAPGIVVIERAQVEKLLVEQRFARADLADAATAAEIGRLLGAKTAVVGDFVLAGGKVQFNARLVDVATGEVQSAASLTGRESEVLTLAVRLGDAVIESMTRKVVVIGADPQKPPPAPPGESEDLADLSRWEILDGTWEARGGALYGSGGHLLLREQFKDGAFEAVVEPVSGPASGVCVNARILLVLKEGGRFRGGTADIEGAVLNWTFAGTWNAFTRLGPGTWELLHPEWKEWPRSPLIQAEKNHFRIEASGPTITAFVNGRVLVEWSKNNLPYGSPMLWVQNPDQVVRFSKMKVTRK